METPTTRDLDWRADHKCRKGWRRQWSRAEVRNRLTGGNRSQRYGNFCNGGRVRAFWYRRYDWETTAREIGREVTGIEELMVRSDCDTTSLVRECARRGIGPKYSSFALSIFFKVLAHVWQLDRKVFSSIRTSLAVREAGKTWIGNTSACSRGPAECPVCNGGFQTRSLPLLRGHRF